jgi:hypothetical protein
MRIDPITQAKTMAYVSAGQSWIPGRQFAVKPFSIMVPSPQRCGSTVRAVLLLLELEKRAV